MVEIMREYLALRAKMDALKAEMKDLQSTMDVLEYQAIDALTESGVDNISLDGKSIYVRKQLWARATADAQSAVQTLLHAGLGDLITLGTQKLSAYFRGTEPDERAPEINAAFETYERASLGVRSSNR